MCGIIGVAGADGSGAGPALGTIMDGLRRLEYRGYDSAGVALVDGSGGIWRQRAARDTHSVEELAGMLDGAPATPTGIGHTRWATHGGPTVGNAHPHQDCGGRVALVHNGIIENHTELAGALAAHGHRLVSETDTELLAHLVEEGLADGGDVAGALRSALAQARGSFAVAAISADEPEVVVAGRRSAPLLVALGEGRGLVASDVAAVIGCADRFYALEDDQVARVGPGTLTVSTLDGTEVAPTGLVVDPAWDLSAAQKGGFDDFMSKEMHEQPQAVADTLLDRRAPDGSLILDELHLDRDELAAVDKIVIAACGSSFHAGLVAKYAIEHWVGIDTEVDIASELRYRDPVLHERTLVVGVSQSGETLDTLEALREARKSGARTLAVTNVVHSMLAREADGVIATRAGMEIGVASTKCHTAQIVALELLALALAQWRGTLTPAEISAKVDALHRLPDALTEALARHKDVDVVADAVLGARDFFFLGRNVGFPVALEGALKLKEISYLRAEGYPAGELKHGPIALVVPGTVVVGVLEPLADKMASNLSEVASRGATMVVVAPDTAPVPPGIDHVLRVPAVDDPLLAPVVSVVPLQLLAYGLARRLGNDVDRPRNLAKTVTVE
jgi:glutamine---fructose-6-phosphate transaminase (isomerizing)